MAALIYMIVSAFLVLLLGVPALVVALSFECDRPRRLNRVPAQSSPSLPRVRDFSSERAAA